MKTQLRPYECDEEQRIDCRTRHGVPFVRDGICYDSFAHMLARDWLVGVPIPDSWLEECREYLTAGEYGELVAARAERREKARRAHPNSIENNQPWEES